MQEFITICVVSHAFFGAVHGFTSNNNLPPHYHGGQCTKTKGWHQKLFHHSLQCHFSCPICGVHSLIHLHQLLWGHPKFKTFRDNELLLGAHDFLKILLHFRDFLNWKIVVQASWLHVASPHWLPRIWKPNFVWHHFWPKLMVGHEL